ncbi:MFS transporter [Actinoplanes sp. NPDC051633]|uniref:MFS transporter n=1 Tax=Actinoplanes sp. NPDC051633 TaxID=3155670 RepID=UPI003434C212
MIVQDSHRARLSRRLLPLYTAAALQGVFLWTPIEKLFMTEIGFDAAGIGVMAAAYAALVPIAEVPSGILADRWSRRGVLMIAVLALAASELVGGLSTNPLTYIGGALLLGVYFAMYTGTMDAIIYDTVLEETGDSAAFEQLLGRARLVESVALVGSALAGGVLAELVGTRATYFLTLPFVLASAVALTRFREPRLHRAAERVSLRAHLAVTYRAVLGPTMRGRLVPVVLLAVLGALASQTIFEFGPLWLVELKSSPVLYGPFWAALMATFGLGGLLAGRLPLDRTVTLAGVAAVAAGASIVVNTSRDLPAVTAAMVVLVMLLVMLGIHVTRMLHDAVPSSVRSGVASGVSALTWLSFLPFALVFGLVTRAAGVYAAGWMITVVIAAVGVVLLTLPRRDDQRPVEAEAEASVTESATAAPAPVVSAASR